MPIQVLDLVSQEILTIQEAGKKANVSVASLYKMLRGTITNTTSFIPLKMHVVSFGDVVKQIQNSRILIASYDSHKKLQYNVGTHMYEIITWKDGKEIVETYHMPYTAVSDCNKIEIP